MNRTLMNHTRAILASKNIEKKFWAETLSMVVYIRNRVTSQSLGSNLTPHHLWFDKAPNISLLRISVSRCWYVLPNTKIKKLDARTREAMMVGYASNTKGYKLRDANKGRFIISRDATFDETFDPTQSETCDALSNPSFESDSKYSDMDDEAYEIDESEERIIERPSDKVCLEDQDFPGLRRGTRQIRPPDRFVPGTSNMIAKELVEDQIVLIAHNPEAPRTYKQATSPDLLHKWNPAIEREHKCLLENNTWAIV